MAGINREYLSEHKLFRSRNKKIFLLFPLFAVLVALVVFWWLKLVGITVTSDAFCGVDEHTHTEGCYTTELICEDETHEHLEECYSQSLICFKPEHTHSAECFPDKTVDVETANDWVKSFESVTITNNVAENLAAIASSQMGYHESEINFELDGNAQKKGYTRYGEWYGAPYANWNTLFVSFCLNYANINQVDPLLQATAESMRLAWQEKELYFSADSYQASKGDVIFFDTTGDGKADRTGIVIYRGGTALHVIEGDSDDAVAKVIYDTADGILGYGMTGELYAASHITDPPSEEPEEEEITEIVGMLNYYIPRDSSTDQSVEENIPSVFNDEPLMFMTATRSGITYTSHLENEVVRAVFKELSGTEIGPGGTVYVGQSYVISLEFSEINTGSSWIQFQHNEDGYLTYHIPSNIVCQQFDDWHHITAKTESGTIEDVGIYFVDENGLLRVQFFEDANGVNFVDKYANVDFTIDFTAKVSASQSGSNTDISFNDKINVNLNVDGGAEMKATKTHGEYDADTHTMEYFVRIEAVHGVVKDLVIDDQIWENHHTLRDTIVVTDLNGVPLDPQPTITNHPSHNVGASGGFSLSGFPDFSAGDGFLITYKTAINDNMQGNETVDMWNGLDIYGKNSNGDPLYLWVDDWLRVELEKMEKDGRQSVLEDRNGNPVPVIEWEVEIRKNNSNLQGTVIIDTLGEGLAYYTGQDIRIKRYDEWGNRLEDVYISWDDVTMEGSTMRFPLPDGYAFDIVYYSTYETLDEGEMKNYTNSVKATINGREEQTNGSADVIGFVPRIHKSARGNDGEFVYFTIEADVPAVIKNWGGFYLTDLAAFWGFDNAAGYLYVDNKPQDMVVTATTQSGQTVTFTPYVEGGPVENTYILIAPAEGKQNHSFNILFNTANQDFDSSKWILDEDSVLTITYKIPFDAKTGTEWEGALTGNLTLEEALLQGNRMANEAYLNYTDVIQGTASTTYEYSPIITKKASVNNDGTIDYTVSFNNTIPGTGGNSGYVDGTVENVFFDDTFDSRLEYVPGSLVVTGYSPWNKELWLCKYRYNGTVTGNTIHAYAEDFLFEDYNEAADASGWNGISRTANFRNYYRWVNAGGRFVYTYKLRVKDEYLYTTELAVLKLDNTAELTWGGSGSSGPVTESTRFETGLIDKSVVQQDTRLDFAIHVNRHALDILPGADKLTIHDTMTDNLSVYWHSILLYYEDANGNWIDFSSTQSQYTYDISFDPVTNTLTFEIPDSLHVKIDYTSLITESGYVSVNNVVKIDGKAKVSDFVDAFFHVEKYSGDASGSNQEITLLKLDGITNHPLPGATFLLYGPMGDPNAVLPAGVPPTIIAHNGDILQYIGCYTTQADGAIDIVSQFLTEGGPYAFIETKAPEGYELLTDPVYFYFHKHDPDGVIPMATTLVAIENFTGSFLIPETGAFGTFPIAITGIVLLALPVLARLIRRKKERRVG